jgi:RND family efflux transporter MFP subunit
MSMFFKPINFFTLAVLFTACANSEEKKPQQAAVKVTLLAVHANNQTQELTYSGTIEPDNTAQIGFAVSGVVNNIMVEEGQTVRQGQLLASIDATEYINALAIADAGLVQAEDMYNRLNELYNKGSLPAKDYIDIKTKLAQAKANKSINTKHITDSRLYAPMSGIITEKKIEKGSTAAPGIPAFTIIKTDVVYAKISVPESEVGALKQGRDALVFIPTLSDSATGKISIINPQGDAVSRTYAVKIKLGNAHGELLPGMIANVKINTGKVTNAITIPAKSVVRDADNITYVFVANEQHKAVRRRITAGMISGTDDIIVVDGLRDGEQVIVAGQSMLKDGSALKTY